MRQAQIAAHGVVEAQAGLQAQLGQVARVGSVALVVLTVAYGGRVYVVTSIEQEVEHDDVNDECRISDLCSKPLEA